MDDLNDVENQPTPFSGDDNSVKDIELQDQQSKQQDDRTATEKNFRENGLLLYKNEYYEIGRFVKLTSRRDLYLTKEEFGTLSPNTKKLYLVRFVQIGKGNFIGFFKPRTIRNIFMITWITLLIFWIRHLNSLGDHQNEFGSDIKDFFYTVLATVFLIFISAKFKYIDCAVFSRIVKRRMEIVRALYGVEYQKSYKSTEDYAMDSIKVKKNECYACCKEFSKGSGSTSSPIDRSYDDRDIMDRAVSDS
ncbi:hypothetical protein M0813_17823 [Anaeramoeba flamelloides]|uniref:Uncharacterized protein n=1 Tax=Anaeramoeba flamelloides TaxID=1746091 RepID=A0ABQ8YU81_9EUKA|nr:hypothetical protein M0813_17823 [Anaeramoeba flamelloides]